MQQYCESVNKCIYKLVAECNRIIMLMGVWNWGTYRTSSITEVVMQMKY